MLFPILEKKSHTDSHTEKVLFCIMALLYKFSDASSCLGHRKMMLDSFQKEYKNIDIVLVSDAFEGIRFKDRKKISPITLSVSRDLSPLPFRPEDFTLDDPFVREILKTGIRVV